MRVAVAGKGGVGKTTISATLARLLARSGRTVVAIDGDSNPNLLTALGATPRSVMTGVLPHGVVSMRPTGPALTVDLDAMLDEHALPAADGVRVVLMGAPAHAGDGCLCSAHATVSALLADLGSRPEVMAVVDMEASPEHLSRGTTRHVDALLLVTEPYYRSLETVRRLAALAAELPIPRVAVVANKVRHDGDAGAIAEFCERHELDLIGQVPRRDAVVDADIRRAPLLDFAANESDTGAQDVVSALMALAERLLPAAPVAS